MGLICRGSYIKKSRPSRCTDGGYDGPGLSHSLSLSLSRVCVHMKAFDIAIMRMLIGFLWISEPDEQQKDVNGGVYKRA